MFFKRKKSWHVVSVVIPKSEAAIALGDLIGTHRIRSLETTDPVFIGSDDDASFTVRHREPLSVNADSRDVYVRTPHGDATLLLILDG